MPIYEYRCPKCHKKTERILPISECDLPQQCECGGMMTKLVSLPQPAIFVVTNRDRLVNTLNDDDKAFNLPGAKKHGERYKQVLGNSLFK